MLDFIWRGNVRFYMAIFGLFSSVRLYKILYKILMGALLSIDIDKATEPV